MQILWIVAEVLRAKSNTNTMVGFFFGVEILLSPSNNKV